MLAREVDGGRGVVVVYNDYDCSNTVAQEQLLVVARGGRGSNRSLLTLFSI